MAKRRSEEILKQVKKIEIATRKTVDSILSGQYHTSFKGQGMHFSEFREYYPGDDIRHIDWKVTARTHSAHIKKFEEERELNVYFLIDLSQSNFFGSHNKSKYEVLTEVCALLAFTAVKNNDKVGLILFSDKIEKHIPVKKGRAHAMRLVTEILNFNPEQKKTKIKVALDYFLQIVKHKSVVFLVSDFLDTNYEKQLKRVGQKHDLICIRVQDQREKKVPKIGIFEFEDAESGEIFWTNTNSYEFQAYFEQKNSQFETKLSALFKGAEVDKIDLLTNEDYFLKIVNFFKKRKK